MSTVTEAIKRVRGNSKQHIAVAIWCEDDVLERAKERGISCSIAEAQEIIDEIDRKQDCSIGITWDTIDCYLDELQAKGKGSYQEVHRKGYIHRAIDAIRENLPKEDLAKEQAHFQKWLDLFDGDKEKAEVAMDIGRPEPKREVPKEQIPMAIVAYNPVGEAIEFVNKGEIGGEEESLPLSVASEKFAENEELQLEVGNYIDELCERDNIGSLTEQVSKKFNLANDNDLREWIEEYLDHYDEIHSEPRTTQDYIYCEDCQMFVDLWKYDHSIPDAGHEGHNWRFVTNEELATCVEDCEQSGCFEENML